MNINQFINEFWETVASQHRDKLREFFADDATIKWHCTNEYFNVEEYLIANCDYPGEWSGEVQRIVETDKQVITIARVWSEEMSCHVTSFFNIEDNKIKELDEYFADDGEAPQWRLDKKIGKSIK